MENAERLRQRLSNTAGFQLDHEDQKVEVPNVVGCISSLKEDLNGATIETVDQGSFETWMACFDDAEQADGVTAWLAEAGTEIDDASLLALLASKSSGQQGAHLSLARTNSNTSSRTKAWIKSHRSAVRAELPSHCESGLPDDHQCSCNQVESRQNNYNDYLMLYIQNFFTIFGQIYLSMAQTFAFCGYSCKPIITWVEAYGGSVQEGDTWDITIGSESTAGFSRTDTTAEEIMNTVSSSAGFEVEGVGGSTTMENSVSMTQELSETMSHEYSTTSSFGKSREWKASGQVWQMLTTVKDTCGGSLAVRGQELALTINRDIQPRCVPSYCYTSGRNGYCCSCSGSSNTEIPNAEACPPPDCPPHAETEFISPVPGGHPVAFSCGVQMKGGETCTKSCGPQMSGSVTVACGADGSVSVASTTCTSS